MKIIATLVLLKCYTWVWCVDGDSPHSGSLRGAQSEPPDFDLADALDGQYGGGHAIGVTLDLSNPDHPPSVTTVPSFAGRTWSYYYTAKDVFPITRIVDGAREVWTASGAGSACKSAKFVSRSGNYKHLAIALDGGMGKFFVQEDASGQWKEIERDDYEERFGAPENGMVERNVEARTPSVPGNALDGGKSTPEETTEKSTGPSGPSLLINIDGVNDGSIVVRESVENGVHIKEYTENVTDTLTSKVGAVVAGKFTFWTKSSHEFFKKCVIYTKGGHSLLYVELDGLVLDDAIYFEKDGGSGWKVIYTETKFNEKLEEMMPHEQEVPDHPSSHSVEAHSEPPTDKTETPAGSHSGHSVDHNDIHSSLWSDHSAHSSPHSKEVVSGQGAQRVDVPSNSKENADETSTSGFNTSSIALLSVLLYTLL